MFGTIQVETSNVNLEELKKDDYQEIKFGTTIYSNLRATKDSSNAFYFDLDIPANQVGVEIVLQLTAISGQFRFCISGNETHPKSWHDCTWIDDSLLGSIVLNQHDKSFKSTGTYGVLVQPIFDSSTEGTDFTFSLSLSSQESYIDLVEGITSRISVLTAPKYYKLMMPEAEDDMYIILTTLDQLATLEVTTNRSELFGDRKDIKNGSHTYQKSVGKHAGVYLSKQIVASQCSTQPQEYSQSSSCYIFIRITPSTQLPYEYSLLAYITNRKVFINEGEIIALPLPLTQQIQVDYSTSSNTKPVSVNIYSESNRLQVIANLYSAHLDQNKPTPSLQHFMTNDFGTNVIHIPVSYLKETINPLVRVSIVNDDVKRAEGPEGPYEFDFHRRIYIQAVSGVRRLSHMVPISEKSLRKGFFNYYLFTKPQDSNAMIYLHVNSGESDLYVKKGSEVLPDLNTYDFRSNSFRNDELMLPKVEGESEGYDQYFVGVYARESTSYTLVASKTSSHRYFVLTPGMILTKDISPTDPILVSYEGPTNGRSVVGLSRSTISSGFKEQYPVVYYTTYNESDNKDFFEHMPTNKDSKIEIKVPGYFQRTSIKPMISQADQQYLFRIDSPVADRISIFVASPDFPLIVSGGEQIGDTLDLNQCQNYQFKYDTEVIDERIDIGVTTGAINVIIKDALINGTVSYNLDEMVSPASRIFRISDVFKHRQGSEGVLPSFKEYIVYVCASEKATQFTLKASKPSTELYRIIPAIKFDISLKPAEKNKTSYYKVDAKNISSLKFKFYLSREKTGFSSVNDILSYIDIYYVTTEDFGYQGDFTSSLDNHRLSASIIRKTDIDEGGFFNAILAIQPANGFLIVRPKIGMSADKEVTAQLIVNDSNLISPHGLTMNFIEQGRSVTLQIVKPATYDMDLIFSACSGTAKVEVFDGDKNMQLISWFMLGKTQNNTNKLNGYFLNQRLRHNLNSQVTFIKITNDDNEYAAYITINSDVMSEDDGLSLTDFFAPYERHRGQQNSPLYEIDEREDGFDIVMNAIRPGEGFQRKFVSFEKIKIEYTAVVAENLNPRLNTESQCSISEEIGAKNPGHYRLSKTVEIKVEKGEPQWPIHPTFLEMQYPGSSRPFYGIVEAKITFLGKYADSIDDDSVVVLKDYFEIKAKGATQVSSAIIVAIFCMAVCLIALFYKVYYQNAEMRIPRNGMEMQQHQRVDSNPTADYTVQVPSGNNRIEIQEGDPTDNTNRNPANLDETI